jgi:hypothetical protein
LGDKTAVPHARGDRLNAGRDIGAMGYLLVRQPCSEAKTGDFPGRKVALDILLPSLRPALDNEVAKRHFWRAFRKLKE